MKKLLLLTGLLCCFSSHGQFSEKSKDYQKFNGLFSFFYDDSNDKIFLEVENLEEEFLYVYSLSSGIGSNDIGLDRGQLGGEQVVHFKKVGNKLLLVQPNLRFRALTKNALEKKSVEQAFAKSILFGFKIVEEIKGKYIIDITDFLMQDAHGVVNRLKRTNQGSYSLDTSKSAFDLSRTRAFPRNLEFDVMLTFKGDPKGGYIRSVTPNPGLVTVAQHHSFIALPDSGYEMRKFDPRSGSNAFSFFDYATPVQSSLQKRYIPRHRLAKKDPSAEVSEAVEPIIYYLDNGTPEPVRSALLEGGRWWNQAYEAIGYKNAFQLKMLPDDADPLDVRYNVIQWVHRSTRGWSYGSSIRDPRTGEIIKGHVSLGSLRIRQDFLIAQALMNKPYAERDDNDSAMLELALARIRQLSAHEIGHTLGFSHNFAASTNNRASVMDYPHPYITLKDGVMDFSEAYDTGIGEWDKVTVAYSYTDFPEGTNETEALNQILEKAQKEGLRYISDRDSRPMGSAHILGHLWDGGNSASEELDRVLKVRATAIENFSIDNIRKGEPNTVLEDVFAPLYFFHRYQTEAAAKMIAGLNYNYAVKGDGQLVVEVADRGVQKDAMQSLFKTLDAETIAIPADKLALFPPRAIGYSKTRESFNGKTGVSFDALSAAETAADMTLGFLLHPERASRLIQQKSLDVKQLGLADLFTQLIGATILKSYKDEYLNTVQGSINYRVLFHIMNLAAHKNVHPQVNALANEQLRTLRGQFMTSDDVDVREMARRITKFLEEPEEFKVIPAPKMPDGSPIGMACTN